MNLKFKTILAGFTVFVAILVYPFMSVGNTNEQKNTIELNSGNVVSLQGEVNDQSVAEILNSLRRLDSKISRFDKKKPIYLFLYTPGGEIQSGLELIEATHGFKHPINTITLFAASMGFQIVQGLGNRYILKNGILMSHRAAGGFEGSFGGKSPSQLDSRYNFWLRRIQELDEQTVKRTNGKQTLKSYQDQYADEMWLTGEQSVEEGYADSVVSASCDSSLDGTYTHTTNFMGVDITYETSKCPLITGALNVKIPQKDENNKINPSVAEDIKSKFIEQFDMEKNVH